jgi:hypothetical protein
LGIKALLIRDNNMTPAEVLSEIRKLPLNAQRQVLAELTEELNRTEQAEAQEAKFVHSLLQKGIISEIPQRLPDDEFRRNFQPVTIKGEPLSETIIKERG